MKKRFRIPFLLCLALLLVTCTEQSSNPTGSPSGLPRQLSKSEEKIIESGTKFGLKIFKTMVADQPDSNIIISPLSISMALGMTYNGAATSTLDAMHQTLEFDDLSEDEINQSYLDLLELLTELDPKVRFDIANSIWYREDFDIRESFVNVNQDYFKAEVSELDFSRSDAADIINAWVNASTNGLIEEIVDNPINPLTVMFLINAIYYKGTWTYEFDPESTHEASFYYPDGSSLTCQMMQCKSEFDYFTNDRFQAIDLLYGDGNFSMTIILPNSDIDIDELIQSIDDEQWLEWMDSFSQDSVQLALPKFKLRYYRKLNDALTAIGMGIAFSGAADFSGMCEGGGLFISEVRHKTYIEVNEEGTEAAAVTSVEIREKSIGAGDQPVIMNVNRPFIFAIRERNSETILFMGKVFEPDWEM